MAPHQQRVVDEQIELDAKHARLCEFINHNPLFGTLGEAERGRLLRQEVVMREYSTILGERIAAFV